MAYATTICGGWLSPVPGVNLGRALRLWFARPRAFRGLAANGMHADYSWRRPGQDYLDIYSRVQRR